MEVMRIGLAGFTQWGEIGDKNEKAPLTRSALSTWRDISPEAAATGSAVNLSRKWAMRHTDKKDCEKLTLTGDWVDKLPKEPIFDDHYQTLFFDMHVEPYKPVYDKQQQAVK